MSALKMHVRTRSICVQANPISKRSKYVQTIKEKDGKQEIKSKSVGK